MVVALFFFVKGWEEGRGLCYFERKSVKNRDSVMFVALAKFIWNVRYPVWIVILSQVTIVNGDFRIFVFVYANHKNNSRI